MTEWPRDLASLRQRLRDAFHGLRTEGTGRAQEAAAIGLGLFIGCLPFYGFHLLLCWLFGRLFRLNRLKIYLAANISNPFMAPWLLFVELQIGAWLRDGSFQPISPSAIQIAGIRTIGLDVLAGSVVLGGVLAALGAAATYAMLRPSTGDGIFLDLVRRASDRYLGRSITAWEFARGKLRGDPVYRTTLLSRLLPSGGTLMDIGCGQGLMLALLAEARHDGRAGTWPASLPAPPAFDRMVGFEIRPRVAAAARLALGPDAEIIEGDVRSASLSSARAVLLFDVLHLMERAGQEALLATLARTLEPGAVILIREADASAGWRFAAVRIGNRLKAIVVGHPRQRFHFRSRTEWLTCFSAHGFQAEVRPMGEGTPFANLLFALTATHGASMIGTPSRVSRLRREDRKAGPSNDRTGTSTAAGGGS